MKSIKAEYDAGGLRFQVKDRTIRVPWPSKEKRELARELKRLQTEKVNLVLHGTTKP